MSRNPAAADLAAKAARLRSDGLTMREIRAVLGQDVRTIARWLGAPLSLTATERQILDGARYAYAYQAPAAWLPTVRRLLDLGYLREDDEFATLHTTEDGITAWEHATGEDY